MAKVKLKIPRAAAGGSQNAGDVVEVSAAEAERLVAAGVAELVFGGAKVETATRKRAAPEKADR